MKKDISSAVSKHFHLIVTIALSLVVLMVGYYFLYALPNFNQQKLDLERQMQEQEKKDKEEMVLLEKEKKENQQSLLDDCLTNAEYRYDSDWDLACKTQKKVVDKAWNDCIESWKSSWFSDDVGKESCKRTTPDYMPTENGSCSLPSSTADHVNQIKKDNENECYKRYPIQ